MTTSIEPPLLVCAADLRGQEGLTFGPPLPMGSGDEVARTQTMAWRCDPETGEAADPRAGERIASAIAAHIRTHGHKPLLILSGPLHEQVSFCASELRRRRLRSLVRLMLCIGEVRHPIAFPAGHFFAYADAIVASTPAARDAIARQLSETMTQRRPRLSVIGDSFDLDAIACHDPARLEEERRTLGIPVHGLVMAAPFRRASRWSALAFQFFKLWSEGHFGDCSRCNARVLHALKPEFPALDGAQLCPHCGHAGLTPGPRQPAATLVQYELGLIPGTPDPEVLAEWLGIDNAMVLRPSDFEATAPPLWSRLLAVADLSFLPVDTVFLDPLVHASVACGTPCLTTDFGLEAREGIVGLRAKSHSWTYRNHLLAFPDAVVATRMFDRLANDAAERARLREGAMSTRASLDHELARDAWNTVIGNEMERSRHVTAAL